MGIKTWWNRTMGYEPEAKAAPFSGSDSNGVPISSFSPSLVDSVRMYEYGAQGYASIYRSYPSVYTVVEFLAWQASQVGIKTYRRRSDTDREELHGSEMNSLLHSPAPGLTYERLIHGTVADLGVYGNAYWRKMESGTERWIVPLPPHAVTPAGGTILKASEYRYQTNAGIEIIDAEKICHFRRYNPEDPRVGVSPLEPLRRILAEEGAAGRNREGFWKNAARNEGVILRPPAETAGAWDNDARARFREDWQNVHAGASNAGKTVILEDGMDYKPIGFSPKDAEFIEGRKLTLETVARAYNIPLSVLGLTQTATFASQKEFHKALYQDTLAPWLKMLAGEIMLEIVPWVTDDPEVYVEFNIQEKLRGSFEEQSESLRASVGVPYMTVNEARAVLNLPELDEPEPFDTPVQPANVIYGGAGSPGEPVPAALPLRAANPTREQTA